MSKIEQIAKTTKIEEVKPQAAKVTRLVRQKRTSLMGVGPLDVDKARLNENYKYRFVNELNVSRMLNLGYEIVKEDGEVDERIVNKDKDASSRKGVLMRTPIELYEQGVQEKRAANQELVRQMTPKKDLSPKFGLTVELKETD